ncbi:MAG: hypothetical protein DRJ65_16180 [Acidobacteria bacterium]|nr:MAG: hypothetical protein DRJ65_16180 [Acidobacteriota bacterium]
MPKGLRMPVGVDENGGAAMVEADDANKQVIMISLSDCDNENAFQQHLGLGSGMIFNINDFPLRAKILRKIDTIFRQFQTDKRFKILKETIEWGGSEGELQLEFKYHDIESDSTKTFTKVFLSKV